jgi:hypothetical protein
MGQQICMYITLKSMMIFQKEEVMVTCFLEKKGYDDFVFLDGCNVFLSKNHV